MAESPLSPVGLNAVVDLHTNASEAAFDDNSGADGAVNNAQALGVNLECPTPTQLRLKLPVLSSSSSDTDGEDQQQPNDSAAASGNCASDAARAASPPPNCAICLGRCKNKCFTDSCMHQFCFKCLCEWSKVKPECPLCKQTFKSIIHNVKSLDQFEEYHVQPPTVQIPHRPIEVTYGQFPVIVDGLVVNGRNDYEISVRNWDGPRVAHRTVMRADHAFFHPTNYAAGPALVAATVNAASGSGNGNGRQNQYLHRGELLDMYRQEYPDAVASSGTLSQLWRRYVYDRKLYALPVCDITGRLRESSARFYRDNPAQVHRLMAWINRDIVCLLRNTTHDVSTVLERVNESLTLMNILSPAFRRRLQPILGSKTAHFIHELNNFARSPFDMIGYDRAVQYSPQTAEEIVIEFSSSASSDEDNASVNNNRHATEMASGQLGEIENTRGNNTEYRVQSRASTATGSTIGSSSSNNNNNNSNTTVHGQPPMVNLLSFTISTTSEGAEAPGVTVAVGRGTQSTAINLTTHNRASEVVIDLDDTEVDAAHVDNMAGSALASNTAGIAQGNVATTINTSIELNSSSSDECEFVLERKPPHLRTPEMVSLHSETDSDVVFVEETRAPKTETFSTTDEGTAEDTSDQHVTTNVHNLRRTVKREERELYNVGASTSAGLRSVGRKRRQKSLEVDKRQQRRRKGLRNAKSNVDSNSRERSGSSDFDNKTHSSSAITTTTSDSDDYFTDTYYERNRGRVKLIKRKPKTRKASKRNTKNATNKSNHYKKDQNKNTEKKATTRPVETETDDLSEDDDSLSLIALKKRLTERLRVAAKSVTNRNKQSEGIAEQEPEQEPVQEQEQQQLEQQVLRTGQVTCTESNASSNESVEPTKKKRKVAKRYCQENKVDVQRQEHTEPNDNQMSTSQVQNSNKSPSNFRLTAQQPELSIATSSSGNYKNTATTKTHQVKEEARAASRASRASTTHSLNVRTSSSESSSSTSSATSSSATSTTTTPSTSSRSCTSEEESDSNDANNVSTHKGVNIFNLNLTLEQMLNSNNTSQSWPASGEAASNEIDPTLITMTTAATADDADGNSTPAQAKTPKPERSTAACSNINTTTTTTVSTTYDAVASGSSVNAEAAALTYNNKRLNMHKSAPMKMYDLPIYSDASSDEESNNLNNNL